MKELQNRAKGPWPTICRAAALHPLIISDGFNSFLFWSKVYCSCKWDINMECTVFWYLFFPNWLIITISVSVTKCELFSGLVLIKFFGGECFRFFIWMCSNCCICFRDQSRDCLLMKRLMSFVFFETYKWMSKQR